MYMMSMKGYTLTALNPLTDLKTAIRMNQSIKNLRFTL
jgi:hypothetical protein